MSLYYPAAAPPVHLPVYFAAIVDAHDHSPFVVLDNVVTKPVMPVVPM